jgi:geranylgeranyl diphosphate synthase, type I
VLGLHLGVYSICRFPSYNTVNGGELLSTSEALTGQDAVHALRDAWRVVEPRMRTCVDELEPPLPTIIGYHVGWCDAVGNPVNTGGGKAVRPAMTLLACEAAGGSRRAAVDAAAAVELVHNFSLVHDDIMDRDTERRHRGTVWSVFGVPAAILAGDALLALAQHVLVRPGQAASLRAFSVLNEAVQRMLHGQMLDTRFETRQEVGVEECLSMMEGKTAALLECACALGALCGGADDPTTRALRGLGHHLGMAFQCIDDLLGIWGDPHRTGKPVWSDLRSRKKSLPVVAALRGDTPAGRALAGLYTGTAPLTDDQLAEAADLVAEAGGRSWVRSAARRHRDEALSCLHSVHPPGDVERDIVAIAYQITDRDD